MIEVKGLTKRYRSLYAIDDVSFNVDKGEIIGFLGPNGAGKTTTMKILTCYLPPTSGTALIDGHDIMKESLEVRRLIGYLPESTPLYPEMSAISYLKFIAAARGIPKDELKKRLDFAIEATGLRKVLYKEVSELSKGYRQRLCLAQALVHDPPILILDEPTTGLDPLQRIEIRELIREIGKTKTVILSTHILPEAEATCDRLVIINLGRIVGDGTPDHLIRKYGKKACFRMLMKADRQMVESAFEHESGVKEYRFEGKSEDGYHIFEVTPELSGREGGELLFRLARENGWTLAELSYKKTTLEDVFRILTEPEAEERKEVA
ncbi:MAG: ABC transporter [Planctomycetota bacterium]|nr:MAG: ABC transporter [Planctomycetota bacterium]